MIAEKENIDIPKADITTSAYHDINRRFGSSITSALGPSTIVEGIFNFDEPLCIDGRVYGEIKSNSFLIVGEESEILADIEVSGIIVLGKVKGTIRARDFVEVRSGGELFSDIYCDKLIIEKGASFNGNKFKYYSA